MSIVEERPVDYIPVADVHAASAAANMITSGFATAACQQQAATPAVAATHRAGVVSAARAHSTPVQLSCSPSSACYLQSHVPVPVQQLPRQSSPAIVTGLQATLAARQDVAALSGSCSLNHSFDGLTPGVVQASATPAINSTSISLDAIDSLLGVSSLQLSCGPSGPAVGSAGATSSSIGGNQAVVVPGSQVRGINGVTLQNVLGGMHGGYSVISSHAQPVAPISSSPLLQPAVSAGYSSQNIITQPSFSKWANITPDTLQGRVSPSLADTGEEEEQITRQIEALLVKKQLLKLKQQHKQQQLQLQLQQQQQEQTLQQQLMQLQVQDAAGRSQDQLQDVLGLQVGISSSTVGSTSVQDVSSSAVQHLLADAMRWGSFTELQQHRSLTIPAQHNQQGQQMNDLSPSSAAATSLSDEDLLDFKLQLQQELLQRQLLQPDKAEALSSTPDTEVLTILQDLLLKQSQQQSLRLQGTASDLHEVQQTAIGLGAAVRSQGINSGCYDAAALVADGSACYGGGAVLHGSLGALQGSQGPSLADWQRLNQSAGHSGACLPGVSGPGASGTGLFG